MANPPKDLSQGFEHWAAKNPMPELPDDATPEDVYKAAGFKFYTINPDQTPGAKVFLPVEGEDDDKKPESDGLAEVLPHPTPLS